MISHFCICTQENYVLSLNCCRIFENNTGCLKKIYNKISSPAALSAAPIVSILQWALERSGKHQNCKLQFPQPDYWPRHNPDIRTVFGIMIEPISFCKIGKMWGTNKQVNKQTKIENFNFHNQIWNEVRAMNKFCFIHFGLKSFLF